MKMNPEDPRLTAYALNELEPGERAAVEAELPNNPECREAVEEIRRAAGVLSRELAAEPCPALSPNNARRLTRGWSRRTWCNFRAATGRPRLPWRLWRRA